MRFGFRKSIGIGGGFKINLTHRGASVSGGTDGARASLGTRGANVRVSVPGTGLYAEKRLRLGGVSQTKRKFRTAVAVYRLLFVVVVTFFFLSWLISQAKRG